VKNGRSIVFRRIERLIEIEVGLATNFFAPLHPEPTKDSAVHLGVKLHSENTLIDAERWIGARALMARIFARGSANTASRWL